MHYTRSRLQYPDVISMLPKPLTMTLTPTNSPQIPYFQYSPPNSLNLQIMPYNKRYTAFVLRLFRYCREYVIYWVCEE